MTVTAEMRKAALALHLTCDVEDVEACKYGAHTFEAEGHEYVVLTDAEADDAARTAAKDTLWAFRVEFLRSYITPLNKERAGKAFAAMQSALCEDAGPLVEAMLGDQLDTFLDDAVRIDGRGHFLAGYDGREVEVRPASETFYLYRTN